MTGFVLDWACLAALERRLFGASARQKNLLDWVGRIQPAPRQVRLVHGDDDAMAELARLVRLRCAGADVVVPQG